MSDDFTNENEKKQNESDSSISSELIRGHINTIILRTLYDGDKYGYEIINEIEEKSKGQYSLKQPTLYSALKRLESQDYVTSYWGGVSNGGRRKYFQITDKGKKIVEQNLAEWEYSRTIIDSLISEKDYDFNNPPPAGGVDFNILKRTTTRVPVGKGDEGASDEFYYGDDEELTADASDDIGADETTVSTAEYADPSPAREEIPAADSAAEPAAEAETQEEPVPAQQPEEHVLSEEEQRRIHENYKTLIGDSGNDYYEQISRRNDEEQRRKDEESRLRAEEYAAPAAETAGAYSAQQTVAYGQETPVYDETYERNREISSELLYANRPAEERNYKDLIARLYDNTRHEEPPQEQQEQPYYEEPPAPVAAEPQQPVRRTQTAGSIEFYDVEEKAENDGLRVTTATGQRSKSSLAVRTAGATFDKGRLLFITALWVFGVALVESIINACLINVLHTNAAYVTLPFVFAVIMLSVFFALFMSGYGKNSKKVRNKSYVSATLIIYVNVLLIICLIAFLVTGFSGTITARNIFVYAILPCIYLFNVPLFAIIYYYLFSKE